MGLWAVANVTTTIVTVTVDAAVEATRKSHADRTRHTEAPHSCFTRLLSRYVLHPLVTVALLSRYMLHPLTTGHQLRHGHHIPTTPPCSQTHWVFS
jgi:hypothetical protein